VANAKGADVDNSQIYFQNSEFGDNSGGHHWTLSMSIFGLA